MVPLRSPTLPPAQHTNMVWVGKARRWIVDPAAHTLEEQARAVAVLEEGPEWTFIESPIEPGNRVVARGAGRLGLAAQGASQSGGHFHADGSFHAEDHWC